MAGFPCRIRIINMPGTVMRAGSYQIEAQVEILRPDLTLGFVMMHIAATGELLRFAKKSADRYVLTYQVPDGAPAGAYPVRIYATDERGAQSESQRFTVRVV
jgi:hypothetical protein